MENINNASFLIDWYVSNKQLLMLIFSESVHVSSQSLLIYKQTVTGRMLINIINF